MSNTLKQDKKACIIFTVLLLATSIGVVAVLAKNLLHVVDKWVYWVGYFVTLIVFFYKSLQTVHEAKSGGSDGGVFVWAIVIWIVNILWTGAWLHG